jgi:hypothetical protein
MINKLVHAQGKSRQVNGGSHAKMRRSPWRPIPGPTIFRSKRPARQDKSGKKQTIQFKNCIIEKWLARCICPFMLKRPARGRFHRACLEVPKRMLILGGGNTAWRWVRTHASSLGRGGMMTDWMQGADRDLSSAW